MTVSSSYQDGVNRVLAEQALHNAAQIAALTRSLATMCVMEKIKEIDIHTKQLRFTDTSQWCCKRVFIFNPIVSKWAVGDEVKITRTVQGTWTSHAFVIYNLTKRTSSYADLWWAPNPERYSALT